MERCALNWCNKPLDECIFTRCYANDKMLCSPKHLRMWFEGKDQHPFYEPKVFDDRSKETYKL